MPAIPLYDTLTLPDPRQAPSDALTTAVLGWQPTTLIASVSGGVDSDYIAWWLRRQFPTQRIILWHAHLAEDWPQTPAHLDALAAALGNCEIVRCQAVYELTGGLTPTGYNAVQMRRLHDVGAHGPAGDPDPLAILNLLDLVHKARHDMPPTAKLRYCTSYLKGQNFDAWARQNRALLGARPLLVTGERWAESPGRAKLPAWAWRGIELQPGEWATGWDVLWLRPGLDKPLWEVATTTTGAGIPLHPAYALQGWTAAMMTDPGRSERGRARVSCRICVFTHADHIRAAAAAAPAIMEPELQRFTDWEAASGRTWQQRGTLPVLGAACGL